MVTSAIDADELTGDTLNSDAQCVRPASADAQADGWHWLDWTNGPPRPWPAYWSAASTSFPSLTVAELTNCRYAGRCLTPTELDDKVRAAKQDGIVQSWGAVDDLRTTVTWGDPVHFRRGYRVAVEDGWVYAKAAIGAVFRTTEKAHPDNQDHSMAVASMALRDEP